MKKTIYFVPAIIFVFFYIWVSVSMSIGSVDWGEAIPFTVSLVVTGILLCKNIFWGGFIGMLPAIYLISFGKNTYTGIELPIGIILFIYYGICSFVIYRKKSASTYYPK